MEFSKLRHFIFFVLLAGVTVAFFTIMKPFFYPLFWAAILASMGLIGLVIIQPDLGTAISLTAIFVSAMLISGVPRWLLGLGILSIVIFPPELVSLLTIIFLTCRRHAPLQPRPRETFH